MFLDFEPEAKVVIPLQDWIKMLKSRSRRKKKQYVFEFFTVGIFGINIFRKACQG